MSAGGPNSYNSNPLANLLFICMTVILLFSPKIPLFFIFAQDVRVEDILSVFLLTAFYLNNNLKASLFQYVVGYRLIAFLGFSIFSTVINFILLDGSAFSFVFVLRWIQYFLVGYVLFCMAERGGHFIPIVFLFFLIIVGIIAIWDLVTYQALRYRGWFSGPWELGTISILCTLAICSSRRVIPSAIAVTACTLVIVAGEARIQIAAFAACLVMMYILPKLGKLLTAAFLSALIIALLFANLEVFERLYGALNWQNIAETISLSARYERDSFRSLASEYDHLDASLLERLFIWKEFLLVWLSGMPYTIFIGIGLGSGGVVIDGLFTRLIVEGGAIGLFLFYRFASALLRGVGSMGSVIFISLAIISVTNDPITAMRISTILFLVLGYVRGQLISAN